MGLASFEGFRIVGLGFRVLSLGLGMRCRVEGIAPVRSLQQRY